MKLYRHYKGGYYVELCRAKWHDSNDWENGIDKWFVVYQELRREQRIFVRPMSEFDGHVEVDLNYVDGPTTRKRFEYIGDIPC